MVGPAGRRAVAGRLAGARSTISAAHPEIWEVILTGGDPLMLSPRRLAEIITDLAAIDHVRIIRIHTRVPVADPAAIERRNGRGAEVAGATTWVAVHANHPSELSAKARAAAPAWSTPAFPWSASRCCCAASMTMPMRWRR